MPTKTKKPVNHHIKLKIFAAVGTVGLLLFIGNLAFGSHGFLNQPKAPQVTVEAFHLRDFHDLNANTPAAVPMVPPPVAITTQAMFWTM